MRRTTTGGLGLILAILASPIAYGKDERPTTMYGVRWHPTLASAIEAAAPDEGTAKPIVWFRVLGDLDGLT
jgi:hypothetical protein